MPRDEEQRSRFCGVRIALQLPTSPARPCARGTQCTALNKTGTRDALAVWTQRRPHMKSGQQYLPRGGANRSSTLENSGTGGHLAPQICAAPAAPSQKSWLLLGLANWAGRCPRMRRALRMTAAREQSLENDVLRSQSPDGRPEARAAAKSCEKYHLLKS